MTTARGAPHRIDVTAREEWSGAPWLGNKVVQFMTGRELTTRNSSDDEMSTTSDKSWLVVDDANRSDA